MVRRDLWLVGAGMNIACAIVGALFHSAFVVIWNMAWLGISIYAIQRIGDK